MLDIILDTIIENLDELSKISRDTWLNVLEVDFDDIINKAEDTQEIAESLKAFDENIKLSIKKKHSIENFNKIDMIPDSLLLDINNLNLLKEFLKGQRKDVVIEFAKNELPKNIPTSILENVNKNKVTLLSLMIINKLDSQLLQQCKLLSTCDKYAYSDYTLMIKETSDDPVLDLEYRALQVAGFQKIILNEGKINIMLDSYEKNNNTKLVSRCSKILKYNGEVLVFILRESHRGSLRTVDKFIVGTNADWIILRFVDNFKGLKVRISESVKADVYESYSRNIIFDETKINVDYIKKSLSNSKTQMTKALETLIADKLIDVYLKEIEISKSPFDGQPSIIIKRKSVHTSLPSSLKDLKNGFCLDEIIQKSYIEKIKIEYEVSKIIHIFILSFKLIGDVYYVYISGFGVGINKKQKLIALLKSKVNLNILEDTSKGGIA